MPGLAPACLRWGCARGEVCAPPRDDDAQSRTTLHPRRSEFSKTPEFRQIKRCVAWWFENHPQVRGRWCWSVPVPDRGLPAGQGQAAASPGAPRLARPCTPFQSPAPSPNPCPAARHGLPQVVPRQRSGSGKPGPCDHLPQHHALARGGVGVVPGRQAECFPACTEQQTSPFQRNMIMALQGLAANGSWAHQSSTPSTQPVSIPAGMRPVQLAAPIHCPAPVHGHQATSQQHPPPQ